MVVITERGKPIARLQGPSNLEQLIAEGRLIPLANAEAARSRLEELIPVDGPPWPSEHDHRATGSSGLLKLYLDASAVCKLLFDEPESPTMLEIWELAEEACPQLTATSKGARQSPEGFGLVTGPLRARGWTSAGSGCKPFRSTTASSSWPVASPACIGCARSTHFTWRLPFRRRPDLIFVSWDDELVAAARRPAWQHFRPREDRRLQVVARRVGEERRDAVEPDLVGDQPLPRIGAAREEGERGAHGRRRVVEGAAQGQLLVVEAVACRRRRRVSRGRPPKKSTVPPGRTSPTASRQASSVPAASITTSAPLAAVRTVTLRSAARARGAPAGRRRRPAARRRRRRRRRASARSGRRRGSRPCRRARSRRARPRAGSRRAARRARPTSGARPAGRGGGCGRAIRSGTSRNSA